jgi:Response regulators consisting of a CheY-like receiver domain and a winged-helix DNA-binding domain
MNVLVIEDDQTLSKNIAEALQSEGIHATPIYDGSLAEKTLKREAFDCIIMDVNLPGKNGFELCKDFRQYNTNTPILMLTAFAQLEDKVQGFSLGADDYLTKPFFMRELVLRVNALTKRRNRAGNASGIITADDIVIDTRAKRVTRQGQTISLTPREYQILVKLAENKGEIVSKSDLINEIWGRSIDANTNTIEVYINFLRNKIDKPFRKNNIKTKVGYGYYFDSE